MKVFCAYIAVISLFFLPFMLKAENCNKDNNISTISVSGRAEISVSANLLKISLAAVSTDKTPEEALKENNEKITAIVKALNTIGLEKNSIQTLGYTLIPNRNPRPDKPPKDWNPVVGYTVNNILLVKTKKLNLAGKIIETSVKAGANKINSLNFTLDNQNIYKNQVIEKAVANASSFAETIAKSTNSKIVKIKSANLGNIYSLADNPRNYSNNFMMVKGAESAGSSPSINPGKIKINANVNITYIIIPSDKLQ
ncbi:MAG TPA: SIMPL domain-containing protein [Victivallales bacterium]|nr:SIMPL domain-containing protein [Victivallales bacterium]